MKFCLAISMLLLSTLGKSQHFFPLSQPDSSAISYDWAVAAKSMADYSCRDIAYCELADAICPGACSNFCTQNVPAKGNGSIQQMLTSKGVGTFYQTAIPLKSSYWTQISSDSTFTVLVFKDVQAKFHYYNTTMITSEGLLLVANVENQFFLKYNATAFPNGLNPVGMFMVLKPANRKLLPAVEPYLYSRFCEKSVTTFAVSDTTKDITYNWFSNNWHLAEPSFEFIGSGNQIEHIYNYGYINQWLVGQNTCADYVNAHRDIDVIPVLRPVLRGIAGPDTVCPIGNWAESNNGTLFTPIFDDWQQYGAFSYYASWTGDPDNFCEAWAEFFISGSGNYTFDIGLSLSNEGGSTNSVTKTIFVKKGGYPIVKNYGDSLVLQNEDMVSGNFHCFDCYDNPERTDVEGYSTLITGSHEYYVKYTNSWGCAGQDGMEAIGHYGLGIEPIKLSKEQVFTLSEKDGSLHVIPKVPGNSLAVYDLSGRQLHYTANFQHETVVPMGNLAAQVVLIKVYGVNGDFTEKYLVTGR